MNPKVFLGGILGGIVTALILRYPLQTVFPGQYVNGWQAVQPVIGWIALCVSILAFVATGAVGARLGGKAGRGAGAICGAVASALAGSLVFVACGGAATGVYGSRMLLGRAMIPAATESEFMSLLTEAVAQTILWSYLAFWIFTLGGAALGALGGALAAGRVAQKTYPAVWLSVSVAGSLAGLMAALVAAVIFSLLPVQIERALEQNNLTLSLPTWIVLVMPVLTALSLLLLFMLIGWLSLESLARQGAAGSFSLRAAAFTLGLQPLLLLLGIYFLARSVIFQHPFLGISLLVLCALGILLMARFRKAERISHQPAAALSKAESFGWTTFLCSFCIGLVALVTSVASLNVVMLVITQIVLLSPQTGLTADLSFDSFSSLVVENYIRHAVNFSALIWAPFVLGALAYLVGWLIDRRKMTKATIID